MITPPWFSLPRTFGAGLLLASVSVPALSHAATQSAVTPDSGAQIRVVAYSPVRRTDIKGVIGQPTTITFPQGENVYRVVQTGRLTKDGLLGDAAGVKGGRTKVVEHDRGGTPKRDKRQHHGGCDD